VSSSSATDGHGAPLFVVILAAVGLEIAIGGLFVWLCLARYSAQRAFSAGAIHDPELPAHPVAGIRPRLIRSGNAPSSPTGDK
jgi:hypothetical protein